MKQTAWSRIGMVAYWALLPAICLYSLITRPRARVIIVHRGSILVVKNWLGAGNWSLPGGGLEKGELAVAAAVRELTEELGITLDPDDLHDFGRHTSVESFFLRSKQYVFSVELTEKPQITIRESEIMAVAWLPIPELLAKPTGVSATAHDGALTWTKYQNLV